MRYSEKEIRLQEAKTRYKYQGSAILVEYQPNAVLAIKAENPFQPFLNQGKDQARDTFCFWIYQENPQQGELRFVFEKNEKDCCFFSFSLNFTGWRTAWVIYERDMHGKPEVGMDALRLEFPEYAGSLYLTDVDLAAKIDPRHPTPDYQVPQVNPNIGASGHWMCLHYFEECRRHAKAQEEIGVLDDRTGRSDIMIDTATIKERQKDYLLEKYRKRQSEASYTDIKERFEKYRLNRQAEQITGVSVDSVYTMEILPEERRKQLLEAGISIDMRKTGSLLLDIALHYQREKSEAVGKFYLLLGRHLLDQGLSYGSSLGTTHHYGYVLKELFESIFLMAEYIKSQDADLLHSLMDMMIWITGLGRIEVPTEEASINIDVLNTYSHAMLTAILFEREERYRRSLLVK